MYLHGRLQRIFLLLLFTIIISSCTTVVKIRDGDTAFERKQYSVAITLLKAEYDNANSANVKAHKAFYLGESYRRIGEFDKARDWYSTAAEHDYGYEAYVQYGILSKQVGKFAEAQEIFQYLAGSYSGDARIQKELATLRILQAWDEEEYYRGIVLENMDFNSANSEYFPRRFDKGKILFLSDRKSSEKEGKYNWTGRNYSSLYLYDESNKSVQAYRDIPTGSFNDGMIARDSTGKVVIFTSCGSESDNLHRDIYCQLYLLKNPGSFYFEVEKLPFVQDEFNYMHPSLNEAGDLLIFSAFLPGGVGKYDLWYSRLIDGEWTEPRLLSNRINTPGDELFPSLYKDTLYFSSDYHAGYGGLDIFKTYLLSDGTWSAPENLKAPVNSGYDEMGFVPDYAFANENKLDFAGYFSSNRPSGKGADDIYFFTQKRIPREVAKEEEEKPKAQLRLNIEVKKKEFVVKDKPNSGVLRLVDLPEATVEILENSVSLGKEAVSRRGRLSVPIDTSMQYRFRVEADNYLNKTIDFNPKGKILPDREVTTIIETVVLDSIYTNVEIVLENIYYDFDRWEIRADAEPTLDTLAMLLKDNPELKIELSSHTDCRGGGEYNRELSQKRAESAVNYLIGKGIAAMRLTPKGYGDSRPAVDCACDDCTEEEHQQNRRTSFTILE